MFRPLVLSAFVGLGLLIPTSSASAQIIVGGYVGFARPVIRPAVPVVATRTVVAAPVVETTSYVAAAPIVTAYPVVAPAPVVVSTPAVASVVVSRPIVRVRPFRRVVVWP